MAVRVAILLCAALLFESGCAPRMAAARRTLSQAAQLGLIRLPRVWVAGFIADGHAKVDLSVETSRLLRRQIRDSAPAGIVDATELTLTTEAIFDDPLFWQRVGEELGYPLIVTGSVELLVAPATPVQRGRRAMYVHGTGRALRGSVVLIDSRTGSVIGTEDVPQRVRYGAGNAWSPETLYYELMDLTLPDWIAAISTAYEHRRAPQP